MADTLHFRGINYDTGTNYMPGWHSRQDWSTEGMRTDIAVIRDQLHCNAVTLFGSQLPHLAECAEYAADAGLALWLQPRLIDVHAETALDHLTQVADLAQALHDRGADVRLNVGCELSIFAPGIIPGRTYQHRATALGVIWPLLPLFNVLLNRRLRTAVARARDHFTGEITYGAGSWESVDWSPFDHVGVNLYRDKSNAATYGAALAGLHRHRKPVLITEFGCCSYPGADRQGGAGDAIIDWSDPTRPRVKGDHPRDESVQQRYLAELLDSFVEHDVTGAFVFEFSEPTYPRSPDPVHDIDVASFGVLAADPTTAVGDRPYALVPKAAFHEIARRFSAA
ncbi:hypothetical protein ACQEVI_27175 [Promicromonospora sp. CA-289599]|uniref:hypothetical protein n=1 Tax=Promicromonospora sp. CA-289599 TaxID=3240014 RepID=UPI003D8A9302